METEFDIHLDPPLYKACKATINKHCINTILSKGGNFNAVLECLKVDFYTNQISEPECAKQVCLKKLFLDIKNLRNFLKHIYLLKKMLLYANNFLFNLLL